MCQRPLRQQSAIAHHGDDDIDFGQLTVIRARVDRVVVAYLKRRFYLRTNARIKAWFDGQLV
jgi:hypothetical protein